MPDPKDFDKAHREIDAMSEKELEEAFEPGSNASRVCKEQALIMAESIDAEMHDLARQAFHRGAMVGALFGVSLGFVITVAAVIWGGR